MLLAGLDLEGQGKFNGQGRGRQRGWQWERSQEQQQGRQPQATAGAAQMVMGDGDGLAWWQRWRGDGLQKGQQEEDRQEEKKVSVKTDGWCWRRRLRCVAAAAKVDGQLGRSQPISGRILCRVPA